MAIQRNARVAPFSVNSPLLEKGSEILPVKGGKSQPAQSTIASTHQKWFLEAQTAINSSAEVTSVTPLNSGAAGEPGTFAFDSNWLYVCVGKNTWRRAALNVF